MAAPSLRESARIGPVGGGTGPLAVKAGDEGPAERLAAFRTSTRYSRSLTRPTLREGGRGSVNCVGPGETRRWPISMQTGTELDSVPSRRQSTASRPGRTGSPSAVLAGEVQLRSTESPARSARRSRTGLARYRDGGRGDPGLAQPTQNKRASAAGAMRRIPGHRLLRELK